MIDLTLVIDMSLHMRHWNMKSDEYSMYATKTLKLSSIHVNGDKLTINTTDGETMWTYKWDRQNKILLDYALEHNEIVKVYVSKRFRDGALVLALANDCSNPQR